MRARARAGGPEGLEPGQQVVKIVHEELTDLKGSADSKLAFAGRPTVVLLCGPPGIGQDDGRGEARAPPTQAREQDAGLVAADLQRPAAIDQLEQLGRRCGSPSTAETQDAVVAAKSGLERASPEGCDVVIVDTAGRLQIDEALMEELDSVRDAVKPLNVLLVLDAMTGQEAVAVAGAFQERIAFDGVVLTKLDGDARRRRAVRQGRHRGASEVRLRRREARPARGVPPGSDGLADPRDGRRAHAHREGRAGRRGGRAGEMERRLMAGQFTFDDFLASRGC